MGAGGGEDAVMPSDSRSHTKEMEEPRAIGRKEPRLKIKMKEGMRLWTLVATEKLEKGFAAEVMDDTGGKIDLSGMIGRKCVAMDKTAGEILGGRKTIGFLDESGIEIDACQFYTLRRQRGMRGEPADVIADTAADIDDPKRTGESTGAESSDDGAKDFADPRAVVELLRKALHFPMDGDKEAIDFTRIEKTVRSR
jgi:hypothetical protein